MSENSGKWKAIAKFQVKETFNPSESDLRLQAQRYLLSVLFQYRTGLSTEGTKKSNQSICSVIIIEVRFFFCYQVGPDVQLGCDGEFTP